jgi:RNA polymerase sigma factor (sigma-70 family)
MMSEGSVRSGSPWPTGGADMGTLVTEARGGSQNAWNQLVERLLPLVTSLIRRHRIFGADADDVNQTVWLRLVEHLDRIEEPLALPGWLSTVTRNECLRMLQKRSRMVPTDPQESPTFERADDGSPDPVEAMMITERHSALVDALLELPTDRRELLLMLTEDPPLTYAEISRRSGIPVGSIGPTRARAIQQLRSSRALRHLAPPAPDGRDR